MQQVDMRFITGLNSGVGPQMGELFWVLIGKRQLEEEQD